ncbi:Arsenate reductase, glutaredoxin family [Shimia gijangensis]|uniref:Arsenate reductase, glutaredoxin family n=1 Tax=Shimia gijangensis TaxID=1470563 RepID=A0A1M6DWE9_9RHOB|nr:ArsC/Spx/MgsR family protein [Shimia gijangensis]SHI77459.1 Arsenate reductase, glutaredoxin family [Shimia gijangensis]
MRLYGLKNCDTCRKALKMLTNAEFVDVRADGVPYDLLVRAFAEFGDALVNSRSTTWRNLSEEERGTAPLDLLVEHPTLMKRPLIERDGVLYLGWGRDVQMALG